MEKLLFDKKKEHNYYEILNCDPSSSKEQITTEYRLLCRKYHPDKAEDNGNDKDTEQYCRSVEPLLKKGSFFSYT